MKKCLVLLVLVLSVCVLVLSSGGAASAAPYRVNIATATTGGAYYPIGNAMAQIWSTQLDGKVRASAQSTAGTPQNIELMQNDEVQIAIGQNGICYYAYYGTDIYEGKAGFPYTSMRGMFTLYPNVMQWVIRKGLNIKSVADLKGKHIVPGQVASATEINSREMLAAYGLNYMKDKGEVTVTAEYLGYNEAADQMKNEQIDATHIAGGVPTAAVIDMLSSDAGELLSMEADKIKIICDKYPWYFPFTIPAGTYPKQDKDVYTIALSNILFTDAKYPDDLVYMLTKATYDFHSDMVLGHSATEYTVVENAFNGMTVPLHPGSIKYFEEKGITVPANLKPAK
ncbi:MAG: TAXI family TRAP transporter solute-binding subunit [Synergistaceae bacterium]|jgi:TRAP transporter TAXI family solute receptor|nr:TAXI family TRAP transporter solute-binding subunit [Synergistaceae bacterium]